MNIQTRKYLNLKSLLCILLDDEGKESLKKKQEIIVNSLIEFKYMYIRIVVSRSNRRGGIDKLLTKLSIAAIKPFVNVFSHCAI